MKPSHFGGEATRTELLSAAFAEHRARAEARLWEAMDAVGLTKDDGWSVVEFTRDNDGGTQLVMRPLHLTKPSPPGLECVVTMADDGAIEMECSLPDRV